MHTRPARVTSGTMRTWADVGKEKGDSAQRHRGHEAGLETRQMGTRLWNVPLSQQKFAGVHHFSDCFRICSLSRPTLIFLKVRPGVQIKFLNSFASSVVKSLSTPFNELPFPSAHLALAVRTQVRSNYTEPRSQSGVRSDQG